MENNVINGTGEGTGLDGEKDVEILIPKPEADEEAEEDTMPMSAAEAVASILDGDGGERNSGKGA